jgi:hypothetical protein
MNMAWYEIEYVCGHEGRIQIYGKGSERQSQADYEATKDCPGCYRERLAKEREEELRKSLEANSQMDLPELKGSSKQIAWAETIRAKKIKDLLDLKSRLLDSANKQTAIEIIDCRIAKDEATYWIDNRDTNYNPEWLVRQIKKKTEPVVV